METEEFPLNVFTKPLNTVTFEDVEAYCSAGKVETAELDYKRELPRAGLAKHIAAMANTLGGTIIIGVEEDATGRPSKWEGVPNEGKLVDQVYQQAANVKPYPNCSVYRTSEKDGRVFVLVQVLEGSAGPYYTVTDPHIVWMRTGNISTPLKPADQDATERIRNRRDNALAARKATVAFARQMFQTWFDRLEEERERRYRVDPERNQHISEPLANDLVPLELILQPYYPRPGLLGIKPAALQARLSGFRAGHNHAHFPALESQPAPNGVMSFRGFSGSYRNQISYDQFCVNGLMYHTHNVRSSLGQRQQPTIYLTHILMELFEFLEASRCLYAAFNYHGVLVGSVRLTNAKNLYIEPIVSRSPLYFPDIDEHLAELDRYEWPLDLDTHELNDPTRLAENVVNLLEDVSWDLGKYTQYSPVTARQFLAQEGYTPATGT